MEDILDRVAPRDYGAMPVPSNYDRQIAEVLNPYLTSHPSSLAEAREPLSDRQAQILNMFSLRMAKVPAEHQGEYDLRLGFAASMIAARKLGPDPLRPTLAVLSGVAIKRGMDPRALFDRVELLGDARSIAPLRAYIDAITSQTPLVGGDTEILEEVAGHLPPLSDRRGRDFGEQCDSNDHVSLRSEMARNVVLRYRGASEDDRRRFLSALSRDHIFALSAFSREAAARAVRDQSPAMLATSALALVVAVAGAETHPHDLDVRDILVSLPLPYDAATRLGTDPDRLYREAAQYVDAHLASFVRGFPDRNDHDKSLTAFHYRAAEDDSGFRYEMVW